MKKLFITVLMVVGITTFAQETKEFNGKREKLTSEQKVDLQVKRLTDDLSLNEKQIKEVKALIEKQVAKREAKRSEIGTLKEKNKEERKALFESKRAEIQKDQELVSSEMKKILTSEQYTKWEKMREQRKESMKEHMIEQKGKRKGINK